MPAFTRKQTKEFFKTTIGCRDDEVIEALEREGIEEVEDLVDFVELDTIKLVLENMRRPVGTMEDPDDSSSQIPIPKTTLGAKAVMRLQASAKLVSYYEEIGRGATPGNTTWKYIKAFKLEDDALKDRAKNDDEPDVPKITKALPILKWTVAFADFLHRVMGNPFSVYHSSHGGSWKNRTPRSKQTLFLRIPISGRRVDRQSIARPRPLPRR